MVEIAKNPEVEKLLESTRCRLMHYEDVTLGINLDLQIPRMEEVEKYKGRWANWEEYLGARWTVLQEGLQKALINRTDISVKAALLVRESPSPKQITEDVSSLSSTSGDIPKPIPYPLMDTENFKPDSTKIGYLVFERIL